jgi:ABC-type Mn2+/Zn2+ transport system permease subunit
MNIDILNPTFWYALCIGATTGSVAAYLGSLMVTKRMTLMAGALGHLTLPGMALALKYNFDVSLGAFLFLSIGTFIIWLLEKQTHISFEALTAIVFTTSVAIAFLFLPEGKSQAALLGDISQIDLTICLISLALSFIIFLITHYIFKKMILITISSNIAQANNIAVSKYNFIYLTCIALMIALGVRIVGGLMTAALVAIPASTSKNLSTNLYQYAYLSLVSGAISCILGIITSQIINIPVGSAIIIVSALAFFVSLIFKRK